MKKYYCQSCKSKGKGNIELKEHRVVGSVRLYFKCPVCHKVI